MKPANLAELEIRLSVGNRALGCYETSQDFWDRSTNFHQVPTSCIVQAAMVGYVQTWFFLFILMHNLPILAVILGLKYWDENRKHFISFWLILLSYCQILRRLDPSKTYFVKFSPNNDSLNCWYYAQPKFVLMHDAFHVINVTLKTTKSWMFTGSRHNFALIDSIFSRDVREWRANKRNDSQWHCSCVVPYASIYVGTA